MLMLAALPVSAERQATRGLVQDGYPWREAGEDLVLIAKAFEFMVAVQPSLAGTGAILHAGFFRVAEHHQLLGIRHRQGAEKHRN